MTRRTKDSARIEAIEDLKQLQDELRSSWLDRSLPDGWSGLEQSSVTNRKKERISIRLDEDMLKWFRAQGPGYQARINRILRIYWSGLVSGMVQSHYSEDSVTPTFIEMVLEKARLSEASRDDK